MVLFVFYNKYLWRNHNNILYYTILPRRALNLGNFNKGKIIWKYTLPWKICHVKFVCLDSNWYNYGYISHTRDASIEEVALVTVLSITRLIICHVLRFAHSVFSVRFCLSASKAFSLLNLIMRICWQLFFLYPIILLLLLLLLGSRVSCWIFII